MSDSQKPHLEATPAAARLADAVPDAPQELERVAGLAAEIDFADPALTITYGAKTMADIARFSDSLLAQVRAQEAGHVGKTLSGLLARLQSTDPAAAGGAEPGPLARLPLIGGLFNPQARARSRFNSLADQVDSVVLGLQKALDGLLRDIEIMEQLYGLNRNFHQELSLAIAAGEQRLSDARSRDLPKLRARAEKAGDNLSAQEARDFADKLDRFERRLHDLKLSRAVTLQTAPQIRLIQGNDQTLAEKIQAGILTAIPIWKSQMVLGLSIHGQKQAARLQQEVSDATNTLLNKNAELLRQASLDTARAAERGVVDLETLRNVHNQLIDSVSETLRISAEARQQRRAVEDELRQLEQDLRARLVGPGTSADAPTPPPANAAPAGQAAPASQSAGPERGQASGPADAHRLTASGPARTRLDSAETEQTSLDGGQLAAPGLDQAPSRPIAMRESAGQDAPSAPIAMPQGDAPTPPRKQ